MSWMEDGTRIVLYAYVLALRCFNLDNVDKGKNQNRLSAYR